MTLGDAQNARKRLLRSSNCSTCYLSPLGAVSRVLLHSLYAPNPFTYLLIGASFLSGYIYPIETISQVQWGSNTSMRREEVLVAFSSWASPDSGVWRSIGTVSLDSSGIPQPGRFPPHRG